MVRAEWPGWDREAYDDCVAAKGASAASVCSHTLLIRLSLLSNVSDPLTSRIGVGSLFCGIVNSKEQYWIRSTGIVGALHLALWTGKEVEEVLQISLALLAVDEYKGRNWLDPCTIYACGSVRSTNLGKSYISRERGWCRRSYSVGRFFAAAQLVDDLVT